MEVWAVMPAFREKVKFVCVCVESRDVAHMFQHMFRFRHAHNSYVPGRRYMPRFGQLGCSGYVIADKNGRLVSGKTRSFLDDGPDVAFGHVEAILAALLAEEGNGNNGSNGGNGGVLEPQLLSPPTRSQGNAGNGNGGNGDTRLSSVELPPSVGVPAMDGEHEECVQSLNDLLQFPTVTNLRQVLHDLQTHFAHEEHLLKAHSFGGGGGGGGGGGDAAQPASFSALSSHVKDHERILNVARNALSWQEKSTETGMCYVGGDLPTVAQKLAKAFVAHASTFDALYEGQIPSSSAE